MNFALRDFFLLFFNWFSKLLNEVALNSQLFKIIITLQETEDKATYLVILISPVRGYAFTRSLWVSSL